VKTVNDTTIGSSRIPHGLKFNPRPIRGTIAIEIPTHSTIPLDKINITISWEECSDKNVSGMKRITGITSSILTGVSFYDREVDSSDTYCKPYNNKFQICRIFLFKKDRIDLLDTCSLRSHHQMQNHIL